MRVMLNDAATVEAWRDLLMRYEWQWFCSLTFVEHAHPERADKLFRVWVAKLNRSLHGRRWRERGAGVRWARAIEWQKRGVEHFHALMADVEDLNVRARRFDWSDNWQRLGPPAGFAQVEDARSQNAVSAYCSKYVAKGGQIDLSASLGSWAQHKLWGSPRR